jgi:hypothetical protein
MCQAVTCRICGNLTWAGCGRHIEQVMAGVPAAQRCPGHQRRRIGPDSSAQPVRSRRSLADRLRRRR